ncbi:MAG: HYR domain-containing protein, partial [Flavobacteriales bacterium]|nr:HYR domain-containing protein [Flavobacteriales bacterium]
MRVFIASAGLCLLFLGSLPSTLLGQCSPDVEKPVIAGMPSNLSLNADADQCGATATWTLPTATDNCNLMSFVGSATPGSYFAVGTTLVTYTAMDASGNLEAESFTITVIDNQDPELDNVPGDITQAADANSCSTSVVWVAPDASDNCGIASTTSTHSSGDSFAFGTTTVTYTTTDVNGRSISAQFDVIVTATDTDGDGTCDGEDTDDDNDGVLDGDDDDSTDPNVCEDSDDDGCDDCSIGLDGFGPLADNTPANDGADSDGDGFCDTGDNCSNTAACNYADPANGACLLLDGICDTCSDGTGTGTIVDNDDDDDGVCNSAEVDGCTDPTACNYDSDPTTDTDNTLCTYVDGVCETCVNGAIVDNDDDDDGVCNSAEVDGCTDPTACNYDSDPTTDTDNTLCTYVDGVCETCVNGAIVDNDDDDDGVCNSAEVDGCTDPTACNYDSDPTTDTDNTL